MNDREKFVEIDGSLMDTLLSNHLKQYTSWDSGKPQVIYEEENHAMMVDIQRKLHGDLVTLSMGVEGIGHFLSRASFNSKGVDDRAVENIGYLIEHLGNSIGSHNYQLENLYWMIGMSESDRTKERANQ